MVNPRDIAGERKKKKKEKKKRKTDRHANRYEHKRCKMEVCHSVLAKTVSLKIINCSHLLLFVSIHKDLNHVPAIFNKSLYCLAVFWGVVFCCFCFVSKYLVQSSSEETFSSRGDFSLGVNMVSDSIPRKLFRMRE